MYGSYDWGTKGKGRIEYRVLGTLGTQAAPAAFAAGNGARVGLIVSITAQVAITINAVASVGAFQNAVFIPFATVNGDHPTAIVSRAQIGDAIFSPLAANNVSAEYTLTVAEVVWHPDSV